MKSNNLKFFYVIILLSVSGLFSQCKKKEKDQLPSSSDNISIQQAEVTCTYTIGLNEHLVDGGNFEPGSVICIEGGKRGSLLLKNFKGTAANPIIFINSGKVEIKLKNNNAYGIKTEECAFIKFTGTGSPEYERGIEIDGPNIGMAIEKLSTNVEIENIEIYNIGFAGIMAKTDPSCDPATWRENFTMKDLKIHDCHIYDTKGEGIYVGNSFYAKGRDLSCGSILPHAIHGVRVYNNKVWNSGWEGIQVGCATEDCEIYNNTVENYGTQNVSVQNNGMQIGEGTTGKFYNNVIKKGTGNGLIVLARGNNFIYNNLIIDAGDLGIFCDARGSLPNSEFTFINNTIINPKNAGILQYSTETTNKFYNNIIAGTKTFTSYRDGASADEKNNLFVEDLSEIQFTNPSALDFSLKNGSPAIDGGMDVASYGVNFDFANHGRPFGNGYDIGAFEFNTGDPVPATPEIPSAPGENTGILVSASSHEEPNKAENTLDSNLQTRWSANGIGEWIKFDLQEVKNVNAVAIAFYEGDKHKGSFDVEVSVDNISWTHVFSGEGSGLSAEPETFRFADAQAKYIRITGKGNSESTLNSYCSVQILDEQDTPAVEPMPSDSIPSDSLPSEPESSALVFEASDDAFIDANNRTVNTTSLQVGPGRNTVYVRFDVTDIAPEQINNAKVQFEVSSVAGGGTVNLSNGSHSNWDENSLNVTRRPVATELLSVQNIRSSSSGSIVEFDVSKVITGEGSYTFVLELENALGARHTTFNSKEGGFAPKLVLQ